MNPENIAFILLHLARLVKRKGKQNILRSTAILDNFSKVNILNFKYSLFVRYGSQLTDGALI